MGREAILLTKYVFSTVYAFIWTKLLILLCEPAMGGAGLVRVLFVAALIAGAGNRGRAVGDVDGQSGTSIGLLVYKQFHV